MSTNLHKGIRNSWEEGCGSSGGPEVMEEGMVDVTKKGGAEGCCYQQELQP